MEETTLPEKTGVFKLFRLSYQAWDRTEGVMGSPFSEEDTKKLLLEDLEKVYGEGKFEVLEFRPLTDEEIGQLGESQEFPDVSDNRTIN